ncbi:MAG: helix-turn-helix transcriptional regulator [Bdellovibrionales bacterium]|nr:helix-turn-helix transcriptional regulator [Bdellovibrionales bacterium]
MSKERRSQCPISFTLDLVGDKWSLLILRDLMLFNKKYYGEFLNSRESISTNILADRLQRLENSGLISKQKDEQDKKRLIYRPTEKGLDLLPLILEMVQWGVKYDMQTAAPLSEVKKMKKDREGYVKNIRKRFQCQK